MVKRHFYKHFPFLMSSDFWYQQSVEIPGILQEECQSLTISRHPRKEKMSYYFIGSTLDTVWSSKVSEYTHWFEKEVLGLKIEIDRGSLLRNLQKKLEKATEKNKKNLSRRQTQACRKENGDEKNVPVPLLTHANNILPSDFSHVQVYINTYQLYNSNWLRTSLTFLTISREPYLNTKEFCTANVLTVKIVWWYSEGTFRLCRNRFCKNNENA